MAEKLGVYICGGCDIGANLDVDALAGFCAGGKHSSVVAVAKSNPVLCSPEGKAMIEADIKENELDGVVCCACSPRAKWDVFKFGDKVQVERVSLREQCVWSYQEDPAFPNQMEVIAKDYCNMGISKLTNSRIPVPEMPDVFKTVLVLGGGFTGMKAALNAAALGYSVLLVEKADTLGGKAATMYKSFPLGAPYSEREQEIGIDALIKDVQANDKIEIITGATLESLAGAPAKYTATVGGKEYEIGAVVMATGWVPGKTKFLAPLGYGSIKNVVTTAEFEALAKNGGIKTPDGKTPTSVAFIVDTSLLMKGVTFGPCGEACEEELPCDDSSTEEDECETFVYKDKESAKHLAYSSELTSLVALKQANYVRELAPDATAYIIYDHMMVPGINEKYYKEAQDDPGIMLTKGTVTGVEEAGSAVIIKAKDTLLGDNVAISADLVVVPTAIVPTTAADPTMNFVYRQGPAFPDLELFDGYADSNYICFPYETRRTGVYAAGCVRQPMGLGLAEEDAPVPPSRRSSASSPPIAASRSTPVPATSASLSSTSPVAPSASAAPRNARSARWTTTRRARRFRTPPAAAVAVPAWVPVRSASSASPTTASTRSVRPSRKSRFPTPWTKAVPASSSWPARTTPTRPWTWLPCAASPGPRMSASCRSAASARSTPSGWPTP